MDTSEIHHQPSLVEGDFFPLESESEVDELDSVGVLQNKGGSQEKHVTFSREKKKVKVSWADSENSRNLCETVAQFFLPKSSRLVPQPPRVRPTANVQPTTIFKDRKNGDGFAYRFFPSQRPSSRLLELRAAAKRGRGTPFLMQPGFPEHRAATLFASVLPRVPTLVSEGRKRTATVRDSLPLSPAVGSGFPECVLNIPTGPA